MSDISNDYSSEDQDYIISNSNLSQNSEGKTFICYYCRNYSENLFVKCSNDHFYCINCALRISSNHLFFECTKCFTIIYIDYFSRIVKSFFDCCYCGNLFESEEFRNDHQNFCTFNDFVRCWCVFEGGVNNYCEWIGKKDKLYEHLAREHCGNLKECGSKIKVNYLITDENVSLFKRKVIKIRIPCSFELNCYLLIDIYYYAKTKDYVFVVKSLMKGVKLDYVFEFFYNKERQKVYASFLRRIKENHLIDILNYPHCDISNIIIINKDDIDQIKYSTEIGSFFSFSILINL